MDECQKEVALLALMEKTGYEMMQVNGQRKYGGPPPGWQGSAPPRGCEVFVGKLPRDMFEDELVPVFERAGRIYEFRLMLEFSGDNRGYAFVMYTTREEAQRAIHLLDNYEIRRGAFIGVCASVDNCRLWMGPIPKNKSKEEIMEEMKKVTEAVVDVIVYPSTTEKTKNRGFAFIEYENHRAAALARRKLLPATLDLWGQPIKVNWAEPVKDVDEKTMDRVKVLYVSKLPQSTTEETLWREFSRLVPDTVERVKKLTDFAFVHFRSREDAMAALHAAGGTLIDGVAVGVSLAKPARCREAAVGGGKRHAGRGGFVATVGGKSVRGRRPGTGGHGDGPFNPQEEEGGGNSQRPMPLLPPQRKPVCPGAIGGGSNTERNMFPVLPGTPFSPTSLYSLKPSQLSSPISLLELYCMKNGWSSPQYYLYSTPGPDGMLLLLYKVVISSTHYIFVPDKLCTMVEDAKELAAMNALWKLDCSCHSDSSPDSPGSLSPPAINSGDLLVYAGGAFPPCPPAPYPLSPISPPLTPISPAAPSPGPRLYLPPQLPLY